VVEPAGEEMDDRRI